jgi:integrase
LTWENVDLNLGIVRLNPGETKNDEAREVYLNEDCLRDIALLFATRRKCTSVFHRKGKKIGDFRKAWDSACKKVGLGGRLFHDLRRTAVRNLVRSGVPERISMKVTGHKTRAVFDRYNIVSSEDLRKATEKLDIYEMSTFGPKQGVERTEELSATY